MKKLILVVVVVLAGLLVYNYLTQGRWTLIPGGSASPEAVQLQDLQRQFDALKQEYSQATRAAAVGGLDTTADIEGVMSGVQALEKKVDKFLASVKDPKVREEASALRRKVESFKRSLGM